MMAGIKGRNTKPELLVRKSLFALGFRYRLHAPDLPGKPDIVLRRYRAAIFVNGCFWHGHDCHLFRMPSTRTEFWQHKISANIARDLAVHEKLLLMGWRRMVIWECALKGRTRLDIGEVLQRLEEWLRGDQPVGEIRGAA
jgi:DNA mismatch endonuclease (patch repair protein)